MKYISIAHLNIKYNTIGRKLEKLKEKVYYLPEISLKSAVYI